MCAVSFVADHYHDKWWPQQQPLPNDGLKEYLQAHLAPTRQEFDELKRSVEEMKQLLKRAKLYDEQTGQPDCEKEEKIEILKRIAELVGVDLNEIFNKNNKV